MSLKIEEYIKTLPEEIISGEDVQLPENSFREIFDFVKLGKNDIFYHLGCGDGTGLRVAIDEYQVKKAVGIDNDSKKIDSARKLLQKKTRANLIQEDVINSDLDDATVILFWFTDEKIIEKMMKKFEKLPIGCKIITIWGPLPGCLPEKVEFPYIINQIPFRIAKDLQEQLLSVFGGKMH